MVLGATATKYCSASKQGRAAPRRRRTGACSSRPLRAKRVGQRQDAVVRAQRHGGLLSTLYLLAGFLSLGHYQLSFGAPSAHDVRLLRGVALQRCTALWHRTAWTTVSYAQLVLMYSAGYRCCI